MKTHYILKLTTPLALGCALMFGACSKDGDNADSLAADSAFQRDLALANRDSAAPTGADTAVGSKAPAARTPTTGGKTTTPPKTTTPKAPSAPAKTPAGNTVTPGPGAAAAKTGTVSAGTTINLSAGEKVCTNSHKAGDRFIATVRETVTGSNGVTIPAGSKATVRVVSMKRSSNVNDKAEMVFSVENVNINGTTYPIQSELTFAEVNAEQRSGKDAQKVAIGAAIGAGIGQILGKDTKSTVIGAATGAAAGTAVAMGTANYEGCIPQGGRLTISLTAPATIGVASN
jgi:hypothetical protein